MELKYNELLVSLGREFPRFSICDKRASRLMHFIDLFLKVVTFWQMHSFMTEYVTIINYKLYVDFRGWKSRSAEDRIILLMHERVHMLQQRRMGGWRYRLTYLLWPLPMVFAYGRMQLEWEAYEETIRAHVNLFGPQKLMRPELRDFIIRQFTGPEYLWTWPWPKYLRRRYAETVARIQAARR